MFNSIIIIKLFYNVIFFFTTTLSQDMFKVYFCLYLYVKSLLKSTNTKRNHKYIIQQLMAAHVIVYNGYLKIK